MNAQMVSGTIELNDSDCTTLPAQSSALFGCALGAYHRHNPTPTPFLLGMLTSSRLHTPSDHRAYGTHAASIMHKPVLPRISPDRDQEAV